MWANARMAQATDGLEPFPGKLGCSFYRTSGQLMRLVNDEETRLLILPRFNILHRSHLDLMAEFCAHLAATGQFTTPLIRQDGR